MSSTENLNAHFAFKMMRTKRTKGINKKEKQPVRLKFASNDDAIMRFSVKIPKCRNLSMNMSGIADNLFTICTRAGSSPSVLTDTLTKWMQRKMTETVGLECVPE